MISRLQKKTAITVILVMILVCLMPMHAQAKEKLAKVTVVSGMSGGGKVTYNKKGLVTAIEGDYYTLRYTYTKSGKVRTVREYDMGEKVSTALFKYKGGKIFRLVYTDHARKKKTTYTVKTDRYGRITSIGSKCTFSYANGCLKKAKAAYPCEQETVQYTYALNKKNLLTKMTEKLLSGGEGKVYKYRSSMKKGNPVKITKVGNNTVKLTYQTVKIKKKYLKNIKKQRRDIQYYQAERLTMDPVMYPAAWASESELLTYY